MFDLKWFLQLKWVTVIKLENKNEQNMISWPSESCSPENSLPEHCPPPENCHLWKLPPIKIPTYENFPLWKSSPLKIAPLKIVTKKITTRKLTLRKLFPIKVATIVLRSWKLLPCNPDVVMKNKAWWPFWWSWVSWKYRYRFNLTWIVVFL